MFLLSVKPSTKPEKKMTAKFCLCKQKLACEGSNTKTVHFGQKGSETYTEGASKEKREAYLKRHEPNESWSEPMTPGSLSRWILWGATTSLTKNIAAFKKKFNL